MKKLLTGFVMISFAALRAQTGMSIVAEGSVSPIILDNVKKIEETAHTKDTTLPAPAFTYTLQTKRYMTTVTLDTIKAAKLGTEPVQKLYRTYAKLGVGNYASMTGEFSVTSLRSKTGAWGAHVRHFSAGSGPKDVAGAFSGFSQQDVNLYGKRFLKKHTLYGGLDFDRDVVYNYGSASSFSSFEKNATRQSYNYYSANAMLTSHLMDSVAINHDIALRYYHMNDHFKVNENNLLLDIALNRYIREQRIDLTAGVDYNNNSSENDTANNTILRFRPVFSTKGNKFSAAIGIGIAVDIGEEALTYFYPQASFSYAIVNHIIIPYVNLGGDLERNSLRTLSLSNPFVQTSQVFSMRNTQHKYELRAGLRGSISKELAYDVYGMRVELVNMPFFVNTTSPQDIFQNKFAVVYDNADVYRVRGQISWQHFEKYRMIASGEWSQYQMTTEAHPWHTPTLRLGLLSEYNLRDKIIAHAELYYLNGQYAKLANGSAVTLKGLADLNLGVEYRYTKFLSGFVNFNNLAGTRYQRWYSYPTQKFNLLAGLTYTF